MSTPKQYRNPRKDAVISDWPCGRLRTTATFSVEADAKRGERAVRVTVDPKTGRATEPKKLTYAMQSLIVDGDDGKTYILNLTQSFIGVMRGDMKFEEETIWPKDARYADLRCYFVA